MLNFIFRALSNPLDYVGILSKETLVFKQHIDEGSGYHSFLFSCQNPIRWKAGQHGIFTMPEQAVTGRKWRAFSIASSAVEKEIRVGTSIRDTPSDFKQKLLNLQRGDTIKMRGPFGEFHLHNTQKQIVAIVGGIGITPLRAILFELANDLHPDVSLELIYAGKDNYFTYKDACRQFGSHPNIAITFVNTPEEVNTAIDVATKKYQNQASYYISGSPGMIKAIKKSLQNAGIKKIINDPFKGY